ncbi:MAG: hypothetical protein AAB229_06760 [Candidatus Hydrogenedentota bacterium]
MAELSIDAGEMPPLVPPNIALLIGAVSVVYSLAVYWAVPDPPEWDTDVTLAERENTAPRLSVEDLTTGLGLTRTSRSWELLATVAERILNDPGRVPDVIDFSKFPYGVSRDWTFLTTLDQGRWRLDKRQVVVHDFTRPRSELQLPYSGNLRASLWNEGVGSTGRFAGTSSSMPGYDIAGAKRTVVVSAAERENEARMLADAKRASGSANAGRRDGRFVGSNESMPGYDMTKSGAEKDVLTGVERETLESPGAWSSRAERSSRFDRGTGRFSGTDASMPGFDISGATREVVTE